MPKAIVFTMLVPVALVTVICAAISFRLMPSGLWRIGPVIGVNWNGGAQARAMETRDVHTVTQHVYFDAVRVSLTNQVIAAYIRRTGVRISPLAQSMAGALGIADPIVKKLISPAALSELLGVSWPVTAIP